MLFVLFNKSLPVKAVTECPYFNNGQEKNYIKPKNFGVDFDSFQQRWDWKSLDEVQMLALRLTSIMRKSFIGVDHGERTSARYDIIELPKVGDPVSKSFNGDSYPCGFIMKITPKFTMTTDTGQTFRRRGQSANWKLTGGTWSMISGHRDERNPSF